MKGLKGGGGHRLLKAMWSIALEPDKQQQPSDRREQQGGTCSCAYPALRRSWVGCGGDGPMAQGHHGTSSPAGIGEVPATKEQRNAGGDTTSTSSSRSKGRHHAPLPPQDGGARRVLSLGKEPASISLPSPPAQGETTLRCQLQLGSIAFPNYNNKKK